MLTNNIQTKIVLSSSFDPYYNLALEEYLVNNVAENEVILYLWQNENTVVIGSNQNPWKECKCKDLETSNGKLARRLSGGGAVFHDLGNLNFTFIASKALYNLEKQLQVILTAIEKQGIKAEFSGRNDLEVDKKKFSGNAFYFTETSAYHHGTILIDVDMSKLGTYLQVSKEKIQSKGIDSVQARVVNLKSLNPNITVETIKNSLKESFKELYGGSCKEFIFTPEVFNLYNLYDKYSSWNWIYGESPSFDITLENKFTWGHIEIGLCIEKAIIKKSVVYSDAMDNNLIVKIGTILEGTPFNITSMCEKIRSLSKTLDEENIVTHICKWLTNKDLNF